MLTDSHACGPANCHQIILIILVFKPATHYLLVSFLFPHLFPILNTHTYKHLSYMSKAHTCLVVLFAHECFTSRGSGGSHYENESFCFMFPEKSIFYTHLSKNKKNAPLSVSSYSFGHTPMCMCCVYATG